MRSHAETARWPPLPLADWKETYHTLHMWTQMVGKVQLALTPLTNHWWNVALHVTARGLTTGPMLVGEGMLTLAFDFADHVLRVELSDGGRREIPLVHQPVAAFYQRLMTTLRELDVQVKIWPVPVEVPDPVRFDRDQTGAYDPEAARRFWQILFRTHAILNEFRGRFIGKCSPVHFFWGSFDLAVTRFSGRPAPARTDADATTREAYSHEVCSCGFWPGSGAIGEPAFYAYAAPEPDGFGAAFVGPAAAFYSTEMKLFIYRYDDMRAQPDPRAALLEFAQTTYAAAASLGGWDVPAVERHASR